MLKQTSKRVLAFVLMLAMTISLFMPMTAFAATGSVSDFASFMEDFEVLEQYAKSYAASNSGKTVQELMINFIRTGVERYRDGNWTALAGEEIVGFTSYVEAQDAATGNSVMDLRDIIVDDFKLPNGNQVDFGHMFGTLNIAYLGSQQSADLGGWAGDLCDLVYFSKMYGNVPSGTIDEMANYVRVYCFGVDAEDAFGMDDFYGDLDAFYIHSMIKGGASLYETANSYFTADLDDEVRSAFFLNNRFKGQGLVTREDVREAVYNAYAGNVGLQVLEADRGISGETDLRRACCYAFADYLFESAGDKLNTGSDAGGNDPDAPVDPEGPAMDNEYYSIFSSSSSTLAPGITQTINYAQTVDKKQIVYYVATVDVNRDDVTIMANYRDNDPTKGWGMQRVEDQAKALVAKHSNPSDSANYIENFNAIVATNADGYNMSTGEPGGLLVMEGVEHHPVDKDGFFAILKDGSAKIGTQADYATYKSQIQEGIGGFGAVLIKDGEIATSKLGSYYSTRASRTAIGITADGKVVMMVLDGRQEPFSAGGAMEEIAQIMLDAGCVDAINLDGGGSTTYLSKPEGEDSLKLVNRPSDGYARSVSTSLVAVSTAKSSKEFDHANISSEYEYLTVNTQLQLTAAGVSNTGNAAPIPDDAQWTVSDPAVGTVTADGLFTATANGDADVQLVTADGTVVGSKTLHVVVPDAIAVEGENVTAVFGVPTRIPLIVTFNGNNVAYNEDDIFLGAVEEEAGVFDGFMFTGSEEAGIRKVTAAAVVIAVDDVGVMFNITLYKADEATFNFDNATSGNKQFAWLREVSNAETKDGIIYQIVDTKSDMVTDYTFALDMTQIAIPDQLADLTSMLPGADTGATAWDFLLQLAERVSVLTEVKIVAQFDSDLNVDISEMSVINEYFKLHSATLDENNKLTLVCKWVDQTAAIDPKTANPICILSGVKLTPKSGNWDANNRIAVVNTGDVTYNIYLRANALYSFASQPANQEKYGLTPYRTDETGYEGGTESGASFGSTYVTFRDEYTLSNANRNGWYNDDSLLYYYVNNELLPAGIYELPSYEDPSLKFWYKIDESGASLGKHTGLIEKDGKLMYAMGGELKKGWQSVLDENGESYYYYFDPYTWDAVGDGEGWIKVEGYNYYFVNNKCMKGTVVKTSKGYQYRFAGTWQRDQWVEFEGNWYYIEHNYVALANGFNWARTIDGQSKECHLFDENGVWMQEYTGIYNVGNDSYYLESGVRIQEPGVVYIDGYYYYFGANAKAVKNCSYWPTKTNGLIPVAKYNFDEYGRITNPPVVTPPVEPDQPDTPVNPPVEPDDPETPDEPDAKNGLVSENGGLFYYKDGKLQYAAGLIYVDGYYYYIRSNGQAAVGNYWVTNTNGLMEQGKYTFGTDGKMVIEEEPEEPEIPDEPEVPAVKNGVYAEDGVLYYYKDGKRAYGEGVVKLADETGREYYIYVRSNAQLATGVYWPTTTNGLLKTAAYHWGTDGRYYPPITPDAPAEPDEPDEPATPDEPETPVEPEKPAVKNGIYEEGGILYYYKDGTRAYGAGVVKLTDEEGRDFYIYVRSNGQLATGSYWPTTTNGLLATAKYDWGTDGRLYL